MLTSIADLVLEAREALDRVWFIQRIKFFDRTDETISLRLYIRDDLFIQSFRGQLTHSLILLVTDNLCQSLDYVYIFAKIPAGRQYRLNSNQK